MANILVGRDRSDHTQNKDYERALLRENARKRRIGILKRRGARREEIDKLR